MAEVVRSGRLGNVRMDGELPLREDVALIRRNVELESHLISDLLDLTRIANAKLQLDVQDIDLHAVVRSAIDICQREASAKMIIEPNATTAHVLYRVRYR